MDKQRLQTLLKALGGGTRLTILAELKKRRSASVSEIAQTIHRSLNTTSIHLAHLERLGIVERRRRGIFVFYRISLVQDPIVKQVLKML